jgi:Flp pilus assembly protein TadD
MQRHLGLLAALAALSLLLIAPQATAQIKQAKSPSLGALKEAVQKNPKDAEAYYKLGLAYSQQGNDAEAIKALDQAVKLKPNFQAARQSLGDEYDRRGIALAENNQFRDAENAFAKAIKANPDDNKPYFNLGVTYGKEGRWADAATAFQQSLERDPNNPYARYNLGMTYLMMDRESTTPEQYRANRVAALEQYRALTNLGSPMAGDLFYVISNPQAAKYPSSPAWQAPPQSQGQPPGPP